MEIVFAKADKLFKLPEPTITDAMAEDLRALLDPLVDKFEEPSFMHHEDGSVRDPSAISYGYPAKQDKEIAALFAALFAFGRRDTGIDKCLELLERMGGHKPHEFVLNYTPSSNAFDGFSHRTFGEDDARFFTLWLQQHFRKFESLEDAFLPFSKKQGYTVGAGLAAFSYRIGQFAEEQNHDLKNHASSPLGNSACKRLSLYLRWMVRSADKKVDLGLWTRISPSELICPIDVHVRRQAIMHGLLAPRKTKEPLQGDGLEPKDSIPTWREALQLTANLAKLCPEDPVKYDFALFSLGEEASRTRKKA